MKKLIALLLLSPLAFADMDKICSISLKFGEPVMWMQVIDNGCERNNILQVTSLLDRPEMTKEEELLSISSRWCRFDRNREIKGNILSCVLYSTRSRT
jgi:hypothetical protein